MILDGLGRFMIGHYFKKLKLKRKPQKVHFFLSTSLVMLFILLDLGFIHHSIEAKMDYLERKHFGLFFNQALKWLFKGLLGFFKVDGAFY